MGKRASLLPFRAAIVLHRDAGVCFDAESVVPERPLVFIEERGLWTVRVDFETHLDPQTPGLQSSLLHQTAPSPVIQEGDEVDGSTVTSITTLDPLAVPSRRPYGSSYLPIAAEHFIAFAVGATTGTKIIRGAHLLDHWESDGIAWMAMGSSNLTCR